MSFIHVPQPWQLPERLTTPEAIVWNRRQLLKTLAGFGLAGSVLPLLGCQSQPTDQLEALSSLKAMSASSNPNFVVGDRPITHKLIAATYNNFYEYGRSKSIWRNAQALPTDDWAVEVTGLINHPRTYHLEDLLTTFSIEERVYRFRCVEAWSMVVPWIGFPMKALLQKADPTSDAKFVRFTSYYDPSITKGPGFPPSQWLPFPYTEGLRIEEMANDLAFFALGAYGHNLSKQQGAPIRAVLPWKYGFKGAKSIVKIEFLSTQPATFWNTINPTEYKFESNVEPEVPHPRWSQAKERLIGTQETFAWEEVPTLKYNGYGDYVASLY